MTNEIVLRVVVVKVHLEKVCLDLALVETLVLAVVLRPAMGTHLLARRLKAILTQ